MILEKNSSNLTINQELNFVKELLEQQDGLLFRDGWNLGEANLMKRIQVGLIQNNNEIKKIWKLIN